MKITQAEWNDFILKMSLLSNKASNEYRLWVDKNGGWDKIDRQLLVEMAYNFASKYSEGSSALAAELYDSIAEREKVNVRPAEVVDDLDYSIIAKGVNGALKHSTNDNYISSVVGRAVKQSGADTMLKNASRDHAEFAWIPSGDTCGFCLMLASKGWQRASKKTTNGNHAEHIHTNCNCQFAVRFNKESNVEGYDPDVYLKQYEEAKQAVLDEGEKATTNKIANKIRYIQKEKNEETIAKAKKIFMEERKLIGNRPLQNTTSQWIDNYNTNNPIVENPSSKIEFKKVKYTIDGKKIKNEHSEEELKTAILLSKALGKKVVLCPTISGTYTGIKTPDYLVGDEQEQWDRKGLHGDGRRALKDAIKNNEKQAHSFVIDINDWKGTRESIIEQAYKVFNNNEPKFVEKLAIVNNDNIILVLQK